MTTDTAISAPLCAGLGREAVVMRVLQIAGTPWFRFLGGVSAEAGRRWISLSTPARLAPVLLALLAGPSLALEPPGPSDPATVCVEVEVGGSRAGHLDCAAAALQQAGRLAQSQTRAAFDTPVVGVRSPDIVKGVASQTALRQRLGSNFGRSAHPQRPDRPAPPPRPSGRP